MTQTKHSDCSFRLKKSLKMPKRSPVAVNRKETNNRMANRKRTKKQEMVWKTLHKLLQLDSKLQQIINCI